jgi:hypothetical protein
VKEEETPDAIRLGEPEDEDPISLGTITQPAPDSALEGCTVWSWKPEGGPDADLVRTFWSPSVRFWLIRVAAEMVPQFRAYSSVQVSWEGLDG